MKADLGVFVHDDDEEKLEDNDDIGNDAEDDTSNDKKLSAKKPKLSTTAHCLNVHPTSFQWKPQITMSVWVSDQLHDMVMVAISLTGGMNINDGCKVFVSDNKNDLIVSEKMINMLADVDLMHTHWHEKDPKAFPSSHAMIMGFYKFFSGIRKREDDDIYSTAIIPLPLQVQKTIVMMQKMGHKDGARVLNMVLRAIEYNNYKAPAKSELVMID